LFGAHFVRFSEGPDAGAYIHSEIPDLGEAIAIPFQNATPIG